MKIYKYVPDANGEIVIPKGYELMHIGLQGNDTPTMWAAVNPDAEKITISFYVKPTGAETNSDELDNYVTTLISATELVWHVFVGKA